MKIYVMLINIAWRIVHILPHKWMAPKRAK